MRKLDRGREIAKPRRRRGAELRAPRREGVSWPFAGTLRFLRRLLPSRPVDALAAGVAMVAVSAVVVNALWLQGVPHPAPLFAEPAVERTTDGLQQLAARPSVPAARAPSAGALPLPAPRPETGSIRAAKPGLVLDIQRALNERGYYEGVVDGVPGPLTQQAIRDFEQAQGLKPTGEVTEALLARVLQARARSGVTGSIPAPAAAAEEQPRPSTQVLAVQRVLARLGYGPLKYTGLPDRETKNAVERFERDRGLTKTGAIGDRLLKELETVTGAPVD